MPLEWIAPEFILAGTLNGFFGDGGVGKDLLLLQLAIAMTCGGKWLDLEVKQGRVIYFPVEDDDRELRRREHNISGYYAYLDMYHPIPKQLKIVPMVGEDTLLAFFGSGVVKPTPLYGTVCKMIDEFRPDLVIVGNRVNIFGVNQNEDAQARQCLALLSKICVAYGAAVIMPSHVSIFGKNSGEGTSGSVQWSNGVRQRVLLSRPAKEDQDDPEHDKNLRTLEVMKANWAATGTSIEMNWAAGVFKPNQIKIIKTPGFDPLVADEEEVLRMLDSLVPGEHVSPALNAPNNAPKIFSKRSGCHLRGSKGKSRLREAMRRLYEKGVLDTVKHGSPSRQTLQIIRAKK